MVVVSAILALVLAGCVSSVSPEPSSSSASIPGLPVGAVPAESIPSDVPNDAGARANVTMTSCTSIKGGWRAGGTVTNPGTKTVEYTITVFFTTDHGTVIGTGDTKESVEPGKTEDWTVSAKLTPAPKTLCVLRGVG